MTVTLTNYLVEASSLVSILWYFVECLAEWRERNPSFCRDLIILPGACVKSLDTYSNFNLLPIYHLHVLFVENFIPSKILSTNIIPAISFTMLIEFFKSWEFIIHVLCREQAKISHCRFFLPGAHVHVVLSHTQYNGTAVVSHACGQAAEVSPLSKSLTFAYIIGRSRSKWEFGLS